MEDENKFLSQIKKLQNKNNIEHFTSGIIMNIEEVEYQIYKLTIKIENNIYKGIYIDINKIKEEYKINDIIKIYVISIIKNERNIYLYLYMHCKNLDIENENIIENNEENNIYDLSPQSIITTLDTNINYKSDIFIYKKENKEQFLFPILTEEKFIIDNNSKIKDFENFILKDEVKNDSLIIIDNYILNNNKISFNNFTLFNKVKLEYLDEYFKVKFNYNYKEDIILYKLNENKNNFILLKVIDIQDKYIICIDYFLNMCKISKDNEKINSINDVYTIIFIKNFVTTVENPFYILKFRENSKIYIFDNSFGDIFLNNLTIINFNFIDYLKPKEKNYFNLIKFKKNNFSFEISEDSVYCILFQKFNLNYNFYPFYIKLKNHNKKEIRGYKFILYLGLLNNVNCLINYFGEESYSIEYFYYNFDYNIENKLPEFHTIKSNDKEYKVTKSDHFDSKARKRFIILNYYDIENVKIYKDKLNKKKMDEPKDEKQIKKNEIALEKYEIEDIISDDEEVYPEIKNYISLLFIFFYEKQKKNLLGIYDINDIKDCIPPKKEIYKPKGEYKIFYKFFNIMNGDINLKKEEKNDYLKSLKKYTNDSDIEELVTEFNKDFSNINYENYIIYINLCLFYYYNLIDSKDGLISDFKIKFDILKKIKMNLYDKIRIFRFSCREYFRTSYEKRTIQLFFMNNLGKENSYRLAINYNKMMINNLNENSKLFIPFLQLDSFILYNYFINSNSYTLSLEPLIVTKKHLLSSYEDFFFTCRQKEKNKLLTLAFQCDKTDVTTINEYGLFPNDVCDTLNINGKDYAVPITIELLHERNGHSKKSKKSKRKPTPLYFYKKKKIVKANKNYQDNDTNISKGEAGRLVEYFIRYKKVSLIDDLEYKFSFGSILDKVNLFTSKNFKDLSNEINEIKNKNKSQPKNSPLEKCLIFNKVQVNDEEIDNNQNNEVYNKKEIEEESLEYYEKKYLVKGKYFVYPHSIPVDYIPYGEKEKEMSKGRIEYLEKYKDAINEGRKLHYGKDS